MLQHRAGAMPLAWYVRSVRRIKFTQSVSQVPQLVVARTHLTISRAATNYIVIAQSCASVPRLIQSGAATEWERFWGQHMRTEHAKECRTRGHVIAPGDGSVIDPLTEAELMNEVVRFAHRFAEQWRDPGIRSSRS